MPAGTGDRNAVIFFTGSLAPFHRGHLSTMNAAKRHLQQQGWNVLGGYVSILSDLWEGRQGGVYPIIGGAEARTIMLQLGARSSDWIMPDFAVDHVLDKELLRTKLHPVQRVVERLRHMGAVGKDARISTFWVNGKDAYIQEEFFAEFAAQADANQRNPLRMLIVDNRDGENVWSRERIRLTVPELEPFITRCRARDSDPTSATRVRAALESGDRVALRRAVGIPFVQSYLMGLMYDSD